MSEETIGQPEQSENQQQVEKEVSTEVVAQPEVAAEQPEQEEPDEMESVLAGYNKPSAHEEAKQQLEAPEEATPQMVAGMPEEELAAKLKQVDEMKTAFDERLLKVNNMLGNIKQRLDAIPQDAPRAEVRAITADSMKKMRELGFDEIADALAEDLNGALTTPSSPQVDIQQMLKSSMREASIQELNDLHPGWQEWAVRNEQGNYTHPEFSAWFNTLSEDMQSKVKTSNSVVFAAKVFDTYKDWEKSKNERDAQARKTSESRLKNAVTPTQGKTNSTPSRLPDESGLWAGYNKGPKPLNKMR